MKNKPKTTAKRTSAKKKTIAKRKTSSGKKLKNMSQTHGKNEEAVFEPRTLDQIWGDTGLGKYKTFDETIYKDRLDNMAKTDLQAHATRVGLVPIDNRSTLTQRLMREFRKHINLFKPTNIKISKSIAKDSLPLGVRKTLDEGK
jgi:hypothetical protein